MPVWMWGNRSKLRRYEMGEVSGKMADLTIITSDNPRDEDPQAIIDDIKIGMAKTDGKYVEILTVRRLLPMRSIMENREISLSSQEKDMRITRRSRVRNIRWMREF